MFLAPISIPYVRDSWLDPLQKQCEVYALDAVKLLVGYGREAAVEWVFRLLQQARCDALFFYSDTLHPHFADDFFTAVRAQGIKCITFHADDEPEAWYGRNAGFDHRFDLVASHSQRGTARRQQQGQTLARYLPWGFNPRRFFPQSPPLAKQYDVVFVGTNNDYSRPGTPQGGGDGRQDTLTELYQHCLLKGYRFRVFGSGWDKHPGLSAVDGGWLEHEAMLQVYRQTRLVFNPGYSADGSASHCQTKLRHFEVPGCGAAQLVNRNPELAALFEEGRDILFFDGIDDLCHVVDHYLAHEQQRQAIAEAGCQRAHREHTTDARVQALLGWTRALLGVQEPIFVPSPAYLDNQDAPIRRIAGSDLAELGGWLETARLDDSLWYHLAVGRFCLLDADYSAVLPVLTRVAAPLLGVSSFYERGMTQDNPMQRRVLHCEGEVLRPRVHLSRLHPQLRSFVLERCATLVQGDQAWPLVNWLVRGSQVRALVQAMRTGNAAWMAESGAVELGGLVSDLRDERHSLRIAPEYLQVLGRLLVLFKQLNYRVLVYGARGEMFDLVLDTMLAHHLPPIALVDRALAGQQVRGFPVMDRTDLNTLAADAMVIAASTSGPDILAGLAPWRARLAIFPLHDLRHPIWQVWLDSI